jgi:hypothetical protein
MQITRNDIANKALITTSLLKYYKVVLSSSKNRQVLHIYRINGIEIFILRL